MIESGTKFGKYRLLERLAVGGMAEIYKASAGGLDGFEKIVAIKRLHRQYSEDADFATMLIDEAQLVVRLSHANIGQVFDLGCIDGHYFIVMEYIDGLDLHELRERSERMSHPLPLDGVVTIAAQVAEALHYAHTKRGPDGKSLEIVHRDVSPQNIMVSLEGEVKLVDFGIAKARKRIQNTQAGIIKGKFYYMSPEQALGQKIDAGTDVFALAMVLYEVLSGSHPYDAVPDSELLRAVRSADFEPICDRLPSLPLPLAEIIDRGLERNRNRRYHRAIDFQEALEGYLSDYGRRYSRIELAQLVQTYDGGHLPEVTRAAADYERMSREHYSSSQASVIFDTTGIAAEEDFEEEATRVFFRDDEPEEPEYQPGGRSHLDGPAEIEARLGAGKEPFEVQERASEDLRRTAGLEALSRDEKVSKRKNRKAEPVVAQARRNEKRGAFREQTRKISERLDHLLRRQPHLVGIGLALIALLVVALAASLFWAGGESTSSGGAAEWHVGIGAQDGASDQVGPQSLAVSTTPANAELYVGGEYVGRTPTVIRDLEVGDYLTLRFERAGYTTKELSIVVEPNIAPLVVRLEPLGGIIQVGSTPEGLAVYLNEEPQGHTPLRLMGLERDLRYRVEVRHPEQDTQERFVNWVEGDERVQELFFTFVVEAEEALAQVEGRRSSRTGSARETTSRIRTARSTSSPSLEVNPFEVAARAEQGRLNVRVNADGARIYINGSVVEEGTRLIGYPLDGGTHEVQVYFSTLKRFSDVRQVEVRVGETSTITISP